MDNFLKLELLLTTARVCCRQAMFCPPFPDEALGSALSRSLQSFREGKLISLTEIMKSHDKLQA
jgi:hypothetical protein